MSSVLVRGRNLLLALAISLLLALAGLVVHHAWGSQEASSSDSAVYQAQEGRGPEANLPYLYAVYSITWAAFFGYLFLVSRRQRELRREIEALRKALENKEQKEDEPEEG